MTATDRFWAKVEVSETCWEWQGYRTRLGYGQIKVAGRVVYAHRFALEASGEVLDDALVVDHLCRNRACVRPSHLEQVSQRVNVLRGESPMAHQARQAECKRGHAFTDDNTITDRVGKRRCRTCHLAWRRENERADRLVCDQIEEQEGWVA